MDNETGHGKGTHRVLQSVPPWREHAHLIELRVGLMKVVGSDMGPDTQPVRAVLGLLLTSELPFCS